MNINELSVLIVDDEAVIRNILSAFLKEEGFEVEVAENGLEALKLFDKKGFDLVLTDLHMPPMDGLTLASKIKNRQPGTLIILMTGDEKINMHPNSFADHILKKPFKFHEFYSFLQCVARSDSQECKLQNG